MKLHICTWSAQNVGVGRTCRNHGEKSPGGVTHGEDHVYKKIELVGSSTDSIANMTPEDALDLLGNAQFGMAGVMSSRL